MDPSNPKTYGAPDPARLGSKLLEILTNLTTDDLAYFRGLEDSRYFVFNFCKTWDPHDAANPIKLFPPKAHIALLLKEYQENLLVAVPKSRQMQVTWTTIAFFLWEAWKERGGFYFFQSKKEEDADELVWRTWHMWNQLPDFLKRGIEEREGKSYFVPLSVNPSNKGRHKYCRFEIVDDKGALWSRIYGVPQGPEQLRMHTAKGIFSDEQAFQEDAERSFIAAKPTIEGGGRFVAVSTAAPGFFERVVNDRVV
jgi:hypothetical protein